MPGCDDLRIDQRCNGSRCAITFSARDDAMHQVALEEFAAGRSMVGLTTIGDELRSEDFDCGSRRWRALVLGSTKWRRRCCMIAATLHRGVFMLRITGGKVYDPANNVNGEVRDVCISGGKIVADVPPGGGPSTRRGMVVFPGGVDVHTHVAGAALELRPRADPRAAPQGAARSSTRPQRRAGIGGHHAHHLRHRLPLRGHGLDHRQRGRGARSSPPSTRTRNCATRRSSTRPAAC